MTYASHKLDVYDVDIHFATNAKAWQKMRRLHLPIPKRPPAVPGWVRWANWHPNDGRPPVAVLVVWVDPSACPTPSELVNTIAHEAAHVTGVILEHVGHDGLGTDEPRAYLTGWLTQWMWDHTPARSRGNRKTAI